MRNKMRIGLLIVSIPLVVMLSGCRLSTVLSETTPDIDKERDAELLTAFFGRDSDLPLITFLLSTKAPGNDGMPLVFSQEVDPATLDVSDFEITSLNGTKYTAADATLRPAIEAFELRTVLLVGEYGDHPENPPVSVKVVGDLMSRSGQNYKGQEVDVIQLDEGPVLSYAEYFTFTDDYPYVEKGRGCDCPRDETAMVARLVWSGGVRAVNGKELGDNELDAITVAMVQGSDTIHVKPYMLADLKDSDNNIDLCLKEKGIPVYVEVEAGIAIDPRDDVNPKTQLEIISRW
ncbi:hypothetical protein [Carboxylicivirga marina]|uniref:Uncharacterized protein n=1 Tax=Carboxylicivirga marina TaxID=2800988 RepID=A0ABS1HHZ0_9BACT|nr:hypothetical protein [Carboxylicivirga marina]MBK3517300.1 hypothetical protein [Carboxylicivirga marina]